MEVSKGDLNGVASKGAPQPPPPPAGGVPPPPPPPPPPAPTQAEVSDAGSAKSALLESLNQGEDITKGKYFFSFKVTECLSVYLFDIVNLQNLT